MPEEDTSDAEASRAESDNGEEIEVDTDADIAGGPRERLEKEADKAVTEFDARVVDILSWVLDTETRARIYVQLRKFPWSTSEEVADGTGLYPSTVREALAELAEDEIVSRRKRESEGAGNNPYEYRAIPPSDLVGNVVGRVQEELNTLFNLDAHLRNTEEPTGEPVRIEVSNAGSKEREEPAADSSDDDSDGTDPDEASDSTGES
ncbi:MAG: ArsR family transcriptional regulator [Halodesulfurarchaeum sp.]